ncbi:hypothetical protein [Sphingomonas astaxanthinifaciens]|uniref:DUF2231 domain-containing protein n=1 Tax=Sphingomonas astaxanthinifaciens DSM 22298 TaxID=1123267 RepID=A0ABQ5Z179_9SPHN|nr:hypothetical protein [Sphingomonas astaxanthinifaciens]GLR46525.1 hypothetical protein GCM10007925_02360 [Sphingomonas astaxanthinifaciens DSM 22298]
MFDKLDAYNLVANLVPGAALTYAFHATGIPSPKPEDIGAFVLVAFVIGVTVNRLGSIVLDPLMRKLRLLKPKDYRSFVTSEREDKKLETIVANAGLYHTFLTAGVVFLSALLFRSTLSQLNHDLLATVLVLMGMAVFFLAFRKEDGYIHTRIDVSVARQGGNEVPTTSVS